jgi:pimeloyl-ACP methyl ester carboxylesterase
VYFVDLPGFTRAVPSLASVSIANYADYAHREISQLGIRSYWVGGVSFGFLVANEMANDKDCQGVLAIEPFFGGDYLSISPIVRSFYAMFADVLLITRTENFIWRSRLTKWMFFDSIKNHEFAKIIRDQIDPRTFFETAKIILLHDGVLSFHKKPYALIINEADDTIAAPKIIVHFNQSVKDGIIIHTTAEHFPKTISKEYFQMHIKPLEVNRLLQFIATASKLNPA